MLHKNEQYIVIGCIAQFPTHKNIENYFQVIGYFYIKAKNRNRSNTWPYLCVAQECAIRGYCHAITVYCAKKYFHTHKNIENYF